MMAKSKRLEIHDAAYIMPDMQADEYDDLRDSIRDGGQQESIKLLGGKVLDGRHRLKAAYELGIDPKTEDLPADTDPVSYVENANFHRRHLSKKQLPIFLVRKSVAILSGSTEGVCGVNTPQASTEEGVLSLIERQAEQLGVGKESLKLARSVVYFGNRFLEELVDSGAVSLRVARDFAVSQNLSGAEKITAIEGGSDGVRQAIDLSVSRTAAKSAQGSASEREVKSEAARQAKVELDSIADSRLDPSDSVVDSPNAKAKRTTAKQPTVEYADVPDDDPPNAEAEVPAEDSSTPPSAEQIAPEPAPIQSKSTEAGGPGAFFKQVLGAVHELNNDQKVIVCRKILDSLPKTCRGQVKLHLEQLMEMSGAKDPTKLIPYEAASAPLKGKLDCKQFREVWSLWCEYQEDCFEPLSEAKAFEQIEKLKHKKLPVAIACIRAAMDAGQQPLADGAKANKAVEFTVPTMDELLEYVAANSLEVDAEEFHTYYESQGWRKANGQKLTSWKAGLLQWHKRESKPGKRTQGRYANDSARFDPNRRKDTGYGKL